MWTSIFIFHNIFLPVTAHRCVLSVKKPPGVLLKWWCSHTRALRCIYSFQEKDKNIVDCCLDSLNMLMLGLLLKFWPDPENRLVICYLFWKRETTIFSIIIMRKDCRNNIVSTVFKSKYYITCGCSHNDFFLGIDFGNQSFK